MKLPLNPALKNLPSYQPGRPIEEVAREFGLRPEEIIKVASNENPLGPSPAALGAMEKALQHVHLYPDGTAFYLKRKLAAALDLTPEHLIFGNGSNEIIEFVGHALLEPGTAAVMAQYGFAIYPIVTRMFGAEPVVVPARDFGHDLPAMRRAITDRTRIVFVANPNNPTGTLASAGELLAFLEAVPPQVLIVMDEAYIEFLDEPTDLRPRLREGGQTNLLLMRTFSKIYGLAGLRLGYGIGHPELIAALERIRQPFNANALAQVAALAALDDHEHVERTRQNNRRGLQYLEQAASELRLQFIPSHANFLMVRVGHGQQVFESMERQGVIVRPMAGYQLPEWIRITVGTPEENARTVAALRQALEGAIPRSAGQS